MGLFTNNKKLCPICGSPTPRLLASAVEGQNLCKECRQIHDRNNACHVYPCGSGAHVILGQS